MNEIIWFHSFVLIIPFLFALIRIHVEILGVLAVGDCP